MNIQGLGFVFRVHFGGPAARADVACACRHLRPDGAVLRLSPPGPDAGSRQGCCLKEAKEKWMQTGRRAPGTVPERPGSEAAGIRVALYEVALVAPFHACTAVDGVEREQERWASERTRLARCA